MTSEIRVRAQSRTPHLMWREVAERVSVGERFVGMYADQMGDRTVLTVLLAGSEDMEYVDTVVPPGTDSYPALTPTVGAAAWYERAIRDLYALDPEGLPPIEPLPGGTEWLVSGYGVFTIPHGPVRSGITETVQFLVETPGEEIPRLQVRPAFKHRGIEARFVGMTVPDGALLAERVEGIASVAHTLAYCHAVERLAGAEVPRRARLTRVLFAELERIANHLDVAMKLADAAGLSAAVARFSWHKENILRLVSGLCGSRFGRGVVVPGGVRLAPDPSVAGALLDTFEGLQSELRGDVRALMGLPSFLDRLRGTGRLAPELARRHGAVGPIGRASGSTDDARVNRPYDAYDELGQLVTPTATEGDALTRLRVRWAEVNGAFHLLRQAAEELASPDLERLLISPMEVHDGRALGWAEAPQGEVVYSLRVVDGVLARCAPRSASFHNLVLFHDVFHGDVLTDFPFIEASFGLSIAGVAL